MTVLDLSNYDADYDRQNNPSAWPRLMLDAGVEGVIIGSQWPDKARWQLSMAKAAGLRIVGTYAEPNVDAAIALAQEFGARMVGIACEPGSLRTKDQLRIAVAKVRNAGLKPYIYGNRGDLIAITEGTSDFADCPLWFAAYYNDGHLQDTVDFCGWTKVAIHQYSSSIAVAGRVRDHNHVFIDPEEEDMTEVEKLLVSTWGAAGEQSLAWEERVTNARYRRDKAITGLEDDGSTPFSPVAARIEEHIAAHPGGASGVPKGTRLSVEVV